MEEAAQNLVLIVDDEPNVLMSLQRVLMDEPYEIYAACTGDEGLQILKSQAVKVVISDERMPGMPGTEFLALVREKYPWTVRIMLTGHASIEAAMKAVNRGEIYRFFAKPWDDLELVLAIRAAVEKYDLEEENRRLRRIVRTQAMELSLMEETYPGITRVDKDKSGKILLPEVSEEEISEILCSCED